MKKIFLPALILASFAIFTLSSLRAEVREWTQSATGNKLKAEFLRMKDENTVTIKLANGRSADVPVASLSEADQTYIKEKSAASAESGKTMEKKDDEKGDKKDEKKGDDKKGEKPALPEGEVTLVISGVHLCCKTCVKDVEAIKDVKKFRIDEDVEIEGDRKDKTITIKAPSGKAAQRAVASVLASGFYGKTDNDALQMDEAKGAKSKDYKSNIMTLIDQHMCCGGCIKAAKKALEGVEGVNVDELEIVEGESKFAVKGTNFKPYDVIMALRAAGFGGSWQ